MSHDQNIQHRLTEEILKIIEAGVDAELSDESFNDYSMQLFAMQYATNTIFREFCDLKNVKPGDISRWQDVPMVYNDVFKTHLVASFPLGNTVITPATSRICRFWRRRSVPMAERVPLRTLRRFF